MHTQSHPTQPLFPFPVSLATLPMHAANTRMQLRPSYAVIGWLLATPPPRRFNIPVGDANRPEALERVFVVEARG